MDDPPSATVSNPLIGRIIAEKYEVLSLIASGGAGDVYKVRHVDIGSVRAAKVLRMSLRGKDDPLLRLQREARTLCKLKHPNVVSVHALDMDPNAGFIMIMDYVDGQSLATYIKENAPLPPQVVREIAIAICLGLQEVHKAGILHRDLKPNNVMVRTEGETVSPVLIDFGLAKFQDTEQVLTQSGAFLGTPLYVSPEQCMSKPMDVRSDIYSFGCLLYELCTGHPPFEAKTAIELMSMHIGVEPEPPSAVRPELAEFDELILTALRKDPGERFANTGELLSALRQEAGYKPPQRKRPLDLGLPNLERRIPLVAAVCLILVVIFFASQFQQTTTTAHISDDVRSQLQKGRGTKKQLIQVSLQTISRKEGAGDERGVFDEQWNLANLYRSDAQYGEAEHYYRMAIRYCDKVGIPRYPEFDQAENHLNHGQVDDAYRSARRLLASEFYPEKATVLAFAARCETELGLHREAYATSLLAFQAARSTAVKAKAMTALAKACIGLNWFKEADDAVAICEGYRQSLPKPTGTLTLSLRTIVDKALGRDSAGSLFSEVKTAIAKRIDDTGASAGEKAAARKLKAYLEKEYERVGK